MNLKNHHFTKYNKGRTPYCVHCYIFRDDFDKAGTECPKKKRTLPEEQQKYFSSARMPKYQAPSTVIPKKRGCQGLYCATQAEHEHRGEKIIYL